MPEVRRGARFLAFAAQFPVVFFDQYGVLHDGSKPYAGAIEAMRALKRNGARVVILSNSGRSGEHNARRMERIGFDRALYDAFVTSGDAAKSLLQGSDPPVAIGAATRCLTLSSSGEHDLADELGLCSVDRADEADLLLISGSQADRIRMADYAAMITPAAARGAPCLCINPDKLMLTPDGVWPGAGAIAALYERLGGPMVWIGKPHAAIYRHAQNLLGSPDPATILCVGDSIEHDIVGARGFAAGAALVRTGILATFDEAELARECAAHGVVPDIVLPDLT